MLLEGTIRYRLDDIDLDEIAEFKMNCRFMQLKPFL
jgi:hypothetical protein